MYLEVGCSLSEGCLELCGTGSDLDVETMVGAFESNEVGRVVGFDETVSLVAKNCCVTTLKPASIDEATSLGRAASSTERAFCVASAEPTADIVETGPFDKIVVGLDDVASCSKAKRRFTGPAVDWVMAEVVAGRN